MSIQNQFSLLYRPFEGELAEACAPSHYNITLTENNGVRAKKGLGFKLGQTAQSMPEHTL